MVELKKTEYETTVRMNGNAFKVMAEAMYLVECFSKRISIQDPKMEQAFRAMVEAWAKGELDD